MNRKSIPKEWKDALPKQCASCGATEDLQYHHIVPLSMGGRDVLSNIAVICASCHSKVHYGKNGAIAHNEAVRVGMQKAKEHGVKLGKKGADYERIMRLIAENSTQFNRFSEMTEKEIMDKAGVGWTTYCKCKRMLIDAMDAEEWPYEWKKPRHRWNRPIYAAKVKEYRGF